MINSKWIELSTMEKKKLLAEISHLLQDDVYFDAVCKILNWGKKSDHFIGVTILPNNQLSKEEENNCIH